MRLKYYWSRIFLKNTECIKQQRISPAPPHVVLRDPGKHKNFLGLKK